MVCFSSSCIYLPHIDTSRNASMCLKNAAEEGQTWIIVVFDNFYSDAFLKHLHAFLEIASTQKVCAGSRERTKYHLKNVENCQEHVQFWVWKICDYHNHWQWLIYFFKPRIEHVPDNSRRWWSDIWFVLGILHIPSA